MIDENPDEAWLPHVRRIETVRTILDSPHRHNLIHTSEGIGCRGCDYWVPKPPGMPDYTGVGMGSW